MLSRVTHVRSYPNLKSYVEVEFTKVDPGFWSIDFEEESAAQGYMPAATNAQPGATKADDFWGSSASVQSASPVPRTEIQDRVRPVEAYTPVPQIKAPTAAPQASAAESISAPPQVKEAAPVIPAAKAPESSSVAPENKVPDEVPSSQAWAELLVMEPQHTAQRKGTGVHAERCRGEPRACTRRGRTRSIPATGPRLWRTSHIRSQ